MSEIVARVAPVYGETRGFFLYRGQTTAAT